MPSLGAQASPACYVALRGVKACASNEVEFRTSLFERSAFSTQDACAPGNDNSYFYCGIYFSKTINLQPDSNHKSLKRGNESKQKVALILICDCLTLNIQ